MVGYAISIQTNYGTRGLISWVTQLVIREDHRKRDVAKRLLFSIWGMSDHFAWGLLTANPYAIRTLEKQVASQVNRNTLWRARAA